MKLLGEFVEECIIIMSAKNSNFNDYTQPYFVEYTVGQFCPWLEFIFFYLKFIIDVTTPKTEEKIKSTIKMNFNLHEHCEPPLNIKFLGAAVHEEITWRNLGLRILYFWLRLGTGFIILLIHSL